ncbi:ABC transporter substrate-binding protein [Catellatospora sp. NPDC049133]|uniref:ABC transporter substrate-binding protein n=1 Tax=Catellatospora sp. NPDC049133 TaxID=3155499 RepID=UPI0033DEAF47
MLTGCSGSALSPDTSTPAGDAVRVGLLIPKSGPYKAIGDDMLKGWNLYLQQHGNVLNGRPITVVEADEGDGKEQARAAAKKLIEQDRVDIIVGGATADTVQTLDPMLRAAKIPLIGTGGRPSTVTDPTYIWHTSWLSQETGAAIAEHIRTTVNGPVFVIGPDYIGGHDQIGGFVNAFTSKGGKLANPDGKPTWTPWVPPTTNFEPFLAKIKQSDAKAVYTFYAGSSAVEFVKQYRQFGINLPLYGAGFLTEGAVLTAQGEAARGIWTVMNYAYNLDTNANRLFVSAFSAAYAGATPNIYHVTSYDAALVLDMAIREAMHGGGPIPAASPTASAAPSLGAPTSGASSPAASASPSTPAGPVGPVSSETLLRALPRIGEVPSPRGPWQFGPVNHTPVQRWYLRKVDDDGGVLANVRFAELATLGS